MSNQSAVALTYGQSHLQSPVDDIESFFWVLLYSIVCNSTSPPSHFDNRLQDDFDVWGRTLVLGAFYGIATNDNGEYGEFACTLSASGLLRAYENANHALRDQWDEDCKALNAVKSHDACAWELCYHAAAISGLLRVLRILVAFKARNNKTT